MSTQIIRKPWQAKKLAEMIVAMEIPESGIEFRWGAPRRTNKQNNYLWGVVYKTLARGLSEEYGTLVMPETAHKLCKKFFMPRVDSGVEDKEGNPIFVEMSTTELCKSGEEQAFQDYIIQIQHLGASKGIYIPDPNEEQQQ